eukprot:3211152-Prymnesium_polylepis.1
MSRRLKVWRSDRARGGFVNVSVCVTRLTWGRCRVSGHSPTSRGGFPRHRTRQRSSGRPGT